MQTVSCICIALIFPGDNLDDANLIKTGKYYISAGTMYFEC